MRNTSAIFSVVGFPIVQTKFSDDIFPWAGRTVSGLPPPFFWWCVEKRRTPPYSCITVIIGEVDNQHGAVCQSANGFQFVPFIFVILQVQFIKGYSCDATSQQASVFQQCLRQQAEQFSGGVAVGETKIIMYWDAIKLFWIFVRIDAFNFFAKESSAKLFRAWCNTSLQPYTLCFWMDSRPSVPVMILRS